MRKLTITGILRNQKTWFRNWKIGGRLFLQPVPSPGPPAPSRNFDRLGWSFYYRQLGQESGKYPFILHLSVIDPILHCQCSTFDIPDALIIRVSFQHLIACLQTPIKIASRAVPSAVIAQKDTASTQSIPPPCSFSR